MTLHCSGCGQPHSFTGGEMERIVYTLQAKEADGRESPPTGEDPYLNVACLKDVLEASGDSECYAEWTQGAIEARHRQAPATAYQVFLLDLIKRQSDAAILWDESHSSPPRPYADGHVFWWCVRSKALPVLIDRGWVSLHDQRVALTGSDSKFEVYRITDAGLSIVADRAAADLHRRASP